MGFFVILSHGSSLSLNIVGAVKGIVVCVLSLGRVTARSLGSHQFSSLFSHSSHARQRGQQSPPVSKPSTMAVAVTWYLLALTN